MLLLPLGFYWTHAAAEEAAAQVRSLEGTVIGGLLRCNICRYFAISQNHWVSPSVSYRMTDYSVPWLRLLKYIAALAAVPLLAYACVLLLMMAQEWDQLYKSRISRAAADMRALETAIDLYTRKYGHFPHEMADLVPGTGHLPGDSCFLRRMPTSPWGTPYHLEIVHQSTGDKVKLWTVPDQRTQDRLHLAKISSDTWPLPPLYSTELRPETQVGMPCDQVPTVPF